MTLENVQELANEVAPGEKYTVASALRELQGLTFSVVAGAALDANITLTGITTDDTIAAILILDTGAAAASGIAQVGAGDWGITAEDTFQISGADTTGKMLLVVWFDKSGGV